VNRNQCQYNSPAIQQRHIMNDSFEFDVVAETLYMKRIIDKTLPPLPRAKALPSFLSMKLNEFLMKNVHLHSSNILYLEGNFHIFRQF
jgi:hypothetical protein